MKYCPRCFAAYEDDAQTYCTNEGTRLLVGSPPESQPQSTLLAPSQGSGDLAPPEFFQSGGTSSSGWGGSSPSLGGQQPWSMLSADAATTTPPRRRSSLLVMIVGSAALLIVGLGVGIMLASRGQTAAGQNGAREQRGAEMAGPDVLLRELKDAESKITEANIKGDKATLEPLLTEDYIAIAADGKSYNKAQTLASTEPAGGVTSWSIDGAKLLSYGKDAATLTGIITFKTRDMVERQQFTDSFTKREGRWQVFASQSTVLK
jgi:hypothetical protein